jgi:hypothetical protein
MIGAMRPSIPPVPVPPPQALPPDTRYGERMLGLLVALASAQAIAATGLVIWSGMHLP